MSRTHLSGGTEVQAGTKIVACVAEANLDVCSHALRPADRIYSFLSVMQKTVFGSDSRAAVYNRTPVENAGILGVGRHG